MTCGRQFLPADSADGGFDMDLGDFQAGPLFPFVGCRFMSCLIGWTRRLSTRCF